MPYPRFQRARAFQFRERKTFGGGNVNVTSTVWVAVDTATDIVLDAQAADVLEAGVSALWGAEANYARLDVAILVSGNPVGCFGTPTYTTTSEGVPAWRAPGGTAQTPGGSIMRVLSASDITAGFVTCRLMARVDLATPARTLNANDASPLQFWVKNLGPQDPSVLT